MIKYDETEPTSTRTYRYEYICVYERKYRNNEDNREKKKVSRGEGGWNTMTSDIHV